MIAGLIQMWSGRLDKAHEILTSLRTTFIERGAESDLVYTGFHLETLECWRGDVKAARAVAAEVHTRALQLGTRLPLALPLSARAHSSAFAGEVGPARRDAEKCWRSFAKARLLPSAFPDLHACLHRSLSR